MLTILNEETKESFKVDGQGAIDLELKLNVTKKAQVWVKIGDQLYDYGISHSDREQSMVITDAQYVFLLMLKTKETYKDCYNL